MTPRLAAAEDAAAIALIYNQGIDDRVATFETRKLAPEDVRQWLGGRHPVVVVEEGGEIVAFAAAASYSPRECYAGVVEATVYVLREARRRRAGHIALEALIGECRAAGVWKLVGRIFPENTASRALVGALGFREVGIHRFHGKLDGEWKDVVLVERLIRENLGF
jgi:phosphinothricin acetyltransferase